MGSDEAEDKIPTGFVIKVYETRLLAEEGEEDNALYVFDNGIDNEVDTLADPTISNGSQFVQGQVTANVADKLTDSAAKFGSRLKGKTVQNDDDTVRGTISEVDSNTLLSLSSDFVPDGNEQYHIIDPGFYFMFVKYFYRIESTDPVIGFDIDWDDGEDNSPEKANRQEIKFETPKYYAVVEHTYTKHGKFYPLIRTISPEGFKSKWYSSADRRLLDRTKSIDTQTVNVLQNDFSILSLDVEQNRGQQVRIPEFVPANWPPTAVLKVDRKSVFSGIDNDIISGNVQGYCYVPRSSDSLTSYSSAVEVIYKTTTDLILKETIGASSLLKDTNCIFPSDTTAFGYLKEVLSVKIVKLLEGTTSSTNKLGPDERIHVMMTTGTAAGTDDVITTVSLGNPIQTLDRPGFSVIADGSASQAKGSNLSISNYIFDTGKLNNYSSSTAPFYNLNIEQISETIGTAQGATNTFDQASSNLRVHYAFKFNKPTGTVFKEANVINDETKRFFETERLIRLQVKDSASTTRVDAATFYETTNKADSTANTDGAVSSTSTTTIAVTDGTVFDAADVISIAAGTEFMLVESVSGNNLTVVRGYQSTTATTHSDAQNVFKLSNNGKYGDSLDHSPIEHWDRSNYADYINRPDDLKSRGILLYANNTTADNTGTPGAEAWSEKGMQHHQTNYSNFSSDTDNDGDTALIFGGTQHRDEDSGTPVGPNKTELSYMNAGHTSRPTNYLLCGQSKKFNKLFMRMSNSIGWRSSAPGELDDSTLYSNTRMNLVAWYTALTDKTSSSYEWKALPILDGTATGGAHTSLRKSGTIYFEIPDDWVEVQSSDLPWSAGNNLPVDSDDSGSEDPNTIWTENMFGILFGMAVDGSNPSAPADIKCNHVIPCNNSHSAIIKVIDPHHKSLNDIAIAQSISWSRSGSYATPTDRFGRAEIRKIGAQGGSISFGGVELKGEYTTQKKLINKYQREAVPVYLDVQRAVSSGEYIRFYGVITKMSEDYPVGMQHPKYGLTMQIEYISEFDSNGAPIGGYLQSLGGDVIDEPKYLL